MYPSLKLIKKVIPRRKTLEAVQFIPSTCPDIPSDIFWEIGLWLTSTSDPVIVNMALTVSDTFDTDILIICVNINVHKCRNMYRNLLPIIYSSIVLKSGSHCDKVFQVLRQRPELCATVQSLSVEIRRPTWAHSSEMDVDEARISHELNQLISNMIRLESFTWDGHDAPKCDDLWQTLRNSSVVLLLWNLANKEFLYRCPRLCRIRVSTLKLEPNSHVRVFYPNMSSCV
jgi:hypothetical protein